MISEEKVVELVLGVESLYDPDDGSNLDEGQQARLYTLYEILDRDLTDEEQQKLNKMREELL